MLWPRVVRMHIDHINIVVSDLQNAIRFYEMLGFERGHGGILEGEWVSRIVGLPDVRAEYVQLRFPGTQTDLELIQYFVPEGGRDPEMSKPNQIGFRHMALRVQNIEELVEHLKNEGVKFFSDIQVYEPKNKKLVYFLGPDDVVLELAEYGD